MLIRSAAVTYLLRFVLLAALCVGASTGFASSGAPNVQVNVMQGRTKIFTGLTDANGRFTTVPVEPGVYTFELRALKTAPPAQYFLLLSGAKPVSPPMADQKAVLTMNAQVRRPRSVTGQVTARRLRIISPEAASASPANVAAPAAAQTARATAAAPVRATAPVQPATAGRVAAQPQMAMPTRAAGPSSSNAARQAAPFSLAPATGLAPRPVGYQSKMINGRPHVWVPIAPGSTLGRWVPGRQ